MSSDNADIILEIFLAAVDSSFMLFRNQLQLLGAVCLLVSWKVREHSSITAQKLIEFTDFNVSLDDLLVRFGSLFFLDILLVSVLALLNCDVIFNASIIPH